MNTAAIVQVPICASTQDEVRDAALRGAENGYTVTTLRQTAGRGRRGRRWNSDAVEALMWSTWIAWPDRPATAPSVSILAGLALADALSAWVEVGIKWPNDIVTPNRRKLAGILCEGVWADERLLGLVVGVGLNLAWRQPPPPELAYAATLAECSSRPVRRIELIQDWRARLAADLALPPDLRGARAAARFGHRLLPDARSVRLKTVDAPPTVGYIEGITAGGELLLRRATDGVLIATAVGELDWADRPDEER